MAIIGGIISLVLSFLWTWLLLWVGAQIVGSEEGSWKNCAILIGSYWVIAAVAIFLLVVTSASGAGIFITLLVSMLGFFYLAIKILNISCLGSLGLVIITGGLNWCAFYLLGKLEGIVPGISFITHMVSYWGVTITQH